MASESVANVERSVLFRTRALAYFALWFLAAISFEIYLRPEGVTETDLSETQQRWIWLPYTPIFIAVGLAYATWPSDPNALLILLAFMGLAAHAILALILVHRRSSFIALICVQVLLLTVGVIYFLRFSRLPSGG